MIKKIFWVLFCFLLGASLAVLDVLTLWGKEDFLRGQNLTVADLEFPMVVLDRYDREIYRSFDQENREWTEISSVPRTLKIATLFAEDKRFYSHFGVDVKGIVRAFVANVQSGKISQGASTITQQIARKVFLNNEKSYERKLRELFIAFGIESRFSKDQILELYLNSVPYGARINGVGVAAKVYFNKPVDKLTEAESLALAVLPQNPVKLSKYGEVASWMGECPQEFVDNTCSPFLDWNYDFSRVESVLFAVAEHLAWTPEKAHDVWQELKSIELQQEKNWVQDDFQHFRFYVQRFLSEKNFDTQKARGGVIIKTTLDSELQKQFYTQLRKEAEWLESKHWISNFSSIVLDHETRGPLVWIGSKDFWDTSISGQVDMLSSRRQTGSTIKPFIYWAAIAQGFQPPTIFYDSVFYFRGNNQRIGNSDGHFLGGIRMKEALAHSRNIPAAKALLLAGGERSVRKFLDQTFGFDINKNYAKHFFGWTLALGTAPVKIMDLANGYATLGSNEYRPICPILEIKTFTGEVMSDPCQIKIKKKISSTNSFFISDILSDESARPADWSTLVTPVAPMAIKTGTSSKRVDGVLMPVDDFVIGYTPKVTVLLWGGNTNGRALKPGSVSVYALGPTWKRMAHLLLKSHPELHAEFKRPQNLQQVNGAWATLDYEPPSYEILNRFVMSNPEQGINPLYRLEQER